MLRSANQGLVRNSIKLRNTSWNAFESAKNFYSTKADSEEEDRKIPTLSARLGAGRGKLLDSNSDDPFASFLAAAQKHKRNNNQRNGNFTPRNNNQRNGSFIPRNNNNNTRRFNNKNEPKEGQFDDAVDVKAEGEQRQSRRPQQRQQQNNRRPMNSANDNRYKNNNNNNNNNNNKLRAKGGNNNRQTPFSKRQPQEIRQIKETEFDDADDIDWSLLDTTPLANITAATTMVDKPEAETPTEKVPVKDIDYVKYYEIGSGLKWSKQVKAENINQLISSNATLDYDQKTAFLSTVAKMTNGEIIKAAAK
ncbi:hypothetical protein BDF20DRAFT_846898 [Mycotypha africana]|uniref:uncharacterized protein n=1 Tax=Mycotypha africana TaxID=64632 RepID=UPI002301A9F9|nr:uncharacterized protein BDF20DRAFT_846898 [Mycotypha africana]KAI8991873.1 hypothetical protein BDF20DRAFT_846898 [Mycotypha africana]